MAEFILDHHRNLAAGVDQHELGDAGSIHRIAFENTTDQLEMANPTTLIPTDLRSAPVDVASQPIVICQRLANAPFVNVPEKPPRRIENGRESGTL